MSRFNVGDRVRRTRDPGTFNYDAVAVEYQGVYTIEEYLSCSTIKLKELPDGDDLYADRYFELADEGLTKIAENYAI